MGLYTKIDTTTGYALESSPMELPSNLVGLSDTILADLNQLNPPPPEFVNVGFVPFNGSGRRTATEYYVNKIRFSELIPSPVRIKISNLRRLARNIILNIGEEPDNFQQLLLSFEDGAEIFDYADNVNLFDPRIAQYFQIAAQLHAFDGYDVNAEIARIKTNTLP